MKRNAQAYLRIGDHAGDLKGVGVEEEEAVPMRTVEEHTSIVFLRTQRAQTVLHYILEDIDIHRQRRAIQKAVVGGKRGTGFDIPEKQLGAGIPPHFPVRLLLYLPHYIRAADDKVHPSTALSLSVPCVMEHLRDELQHRNKVLGVADMETVDLIAVLRVIEEAACLGAVPL